MKSLVILGLAATFVWSSGQPCPIEPVLQAILARVDELSPPDHQRTPTDVWVDYRSFVPMITAAAGREISVPEIRSLAGNRFIPGGRAEAIRCEPNNVHCVLQGGAAFVEVLDYQIDTAGTLAVTVSYSLPEQRRSGAVGICSRWERLTFHRASRVWTYRSAQTARRC